MRSRKERSEMEIEREQCAEAVVELHSETVCKRRIPKRYRLPVLDERLRRERTRMEAKTISEARRHGVPTPIIFDVDDYEIVMERIHGKIARDVLDDKICEKMGETVAKLHNASIIHGDLTTSNFIVGCDGRVYLIDFGLSFFDTTTESRGVDIHVFFQCLRGTHASHEHSFRHAFLRGYRRFFAGDADAVIRRADEIWLRGRFVERRSGGRGGDHGDPR